MENRSRKFNLLIFSRLPRYVYMDDILSRFKRKERGSSSSDSETSPQGKRVCSQEPNETDEILVALDMWKHIGAKLQQVLDKLGEMDKKIESVMANVASLEKTMTNIQSEVSSLKVRADSAETKLKEMDTGLQFANAEVEDLKTQSKNNQQSIVSLKERLLYQEVYNRRENLRFFGLPESTESTIEDSSEVLYRFLEIEILISKGLVILSFREFIASEGKKKAPRAPSSHVSLDILIGNGSLKLLWKHRMRLMLKCMQIYLRRYKKIGRSNGHG